MSEEANPVLADKLSPWIELLDKGLADKPVHSRPMEVAIRLVAEEIIEVSGPGTKDDFFLQDWFGLLVAICTRWYSRRYGEDLLLPRESTVAAGVLIFGTLFEVTVPTNPTRPGKRKGTVDLYFTSRLLVDEHPRQWIVTPPSFTQLTPEQSSDLEEQLKTVCERTRSIINGLAGSALDREVQALAHSIPTHLGNAISSFARADTPSKQLAVWELHLSVEKALKTYIRQREFTSVPQIHDLRKLLELAKQSGLRSIADALIADLPATKDVLSYRYGELPAPYVEVFFEWYVSSLEIIDACMNELPRGFFAEHATITIQALPWHPSRRGEVSAETEESSDTN